MDRPEKTPTKASHLQIGKVNGSSQSTKPHDSNGWDGKARVERRAVITNPEALSDPEYSDEDAPLVEQIDADEGGSVSARAFTCSR